MSDRLRKHRKRRSDRGPGRGLIITVDLEDHTVPPAVPRFDRAIEPLLAVLAERQARATFFVVGELIPKWIGQLRDLAGAGHEIGLHGFTHRRVLDLGPKSFSDEIRQGIETLGEHVGVSPTGFRAPFCSITERTPWAPEILSDAGFTYSASVVPAWNPVAGYPGAPTRPFRWRCGLLEIPAPVFGLRRFALPALGGAYLRLMPQAVVWMASRRRSADNGDWTYIHPYDLDTEEPFFQHPGQSWIEAKLLFARRSHMLHRVTRFIEGGTPTLGEYAQRLGNSAKLPEFG